jgi:HD-GYP domain-containing protein (c-di-GMP phosphodiesterase class II)
MFTDRHISPVARLITSGLPIRQIFLIALLLLIGLLHWITPISHGELHVIHVFLRKSFVIPIVLAAIWYEIKGSVGIASLVSLVYLPHIFLQWSGQYAENINQIGELASLWIIAILSGFFVRIEKNALREVADTHEGSLIALVAALDAREHETELHSLRVQAYSLKIADQFELDEQIRVILIHASLLHDIGKIGIPDNILLKPGPLDETEWQTMKQHPTIGYRLIQSIPFLKQASQTVYCHHEKFDGSGYPCGLKGDEIPLTARIFAVADVFDALTSDRPYHKKISHEDAFKVIVDNKGKHFDPHVVEAFMSIPYDEWQQIDQRLASACQLSLKEFLSFIKSEKATS